MGLAIACYEAYHQKASIDKDVILSYQFQENKERKSAIAMMAPNASAKGQHAAATKPSLGRILLLDDEVMLLEVLEEMLERLGFEVAVATSVEEALVLLNDVAVPFRVAILDLNIPGGPGGLDLVQPLRRFAPQALLIATSGAPTEPPMQEPLSFGFEASLEKPYRLNELRHLLAMFGLI